MAKDAVVVKATKVQNDLSPVQRQSQQRQTAAALGAFERKLALAQMPLSQWRLTVSCRQHQMDARLEDGACGKNLLL